MLYHLLIYVALGAMGHVSAQNRIVNGVEAAPHTWPWQASLQAQTGTGWYHVCGGSLVQQQWVMTAAHCIQADRVYRMVLGKHNLRINEPAQFESTIALSVVHPSWNNHPTRGFDIALMKLSSAAPLSEQIKLAVLPRVGQELWDNVTCMATGWGLLASDGKFPSVLQEAKLPFVNYSTCSQQEWWWYGVNTNLICAGDDHAVCNGDSGGPLSCQEPNGSWVVYGITSFGHKNCSVFHKPSVFTRVSAYTDWVSQVMETSSRSTASLCSAHLLMLGLTQSLVSLFRN
ncbi:chymotrypsin-like elastase family member 2A [Petromyzon marinus]|uniref:chymotrypsin-like elastase family member 2A n=1 Tax=Petromyzon marinus TaxID=7757 RepID=UPI003F71D5EF